ncbi:MAG: RDD family protein [Terriglobales bacterium]
MPPPLAAFSNPAMACPLCGDPCTCSHGGAASSLVDPEEYDVSEERFSASLEEASAERAPGVTATERYREAEPLRNLVGPAPEASLAVDEGTLWRDEVTSRVESYRARRRRPVRERSLPLDFERAVNREMTLGHLSSEGDEADSPPADDRVETADEIRAAPQHEQAGSTDPTPKAGEPRPSDPSEESNLIEFPRQAMLPVMPPSFEELAEPMIDRPRILEAPEEVDAASPLADISVAPEEEQPVVEFELPLQVAPMWQRVFAAMVDVVIVLIATAVFFSIASKMGVAMPHSKTGFLLAMAPPGVLWAVYEYLFLVHAGVTLGMQTARLQLVTFDGQRPRRRTRRVRAIAMVLSTLSLGLGVIWALLDEDTLCWHDRITRTYLVAGTS